MNCGGVQHVIKCACVCSYTKWIWYQPPYSFSSNICTQHCGGPTTESGGECSDLKCSSLCSVGTELSSLCAVTEAWAHAEYTQCLECGNVWGGVNYFDL